MNGYTVILEGDDASGYSAYTLDFPGIVVATGATRSECLDDMASAIAFHIDCLQQDGETVPPPDSSPLEVVRVAPAAAA
jgi:predicted RNase H-like HicB family nuclease